MFVKRLAETVRKAGQIKPSDAAATYWDAIIVGAGPAGATAALRLAAEGHEILMIDRFEFPRDKICGDALIPDAINALKRAGLYEQVRELSYETHLTAVYSPSRIRFDVPGQYLTLKRLLLDGLIVNKAISAGASFCRSRAKLVEIDSAETVSILVEEEKHPIRARVLLLATGASIELPSQLGLVKTRGPSAVALRCYVESKAEVDHLIITYDRAITPGYAWIFPLGNGEFNMGCGITYRRGVSRSLSLRSVFDKFVKEFPPARKLMDIASSAGPLRGAMLRCGLRGTNPIGNGNVLVIGESVGSTFPFSGEGIGKAMETGEIAASVAHEALRTGDYLVLRRYPSLLETVLKPKFLGYKAAERFLSNPWLNDLVARRVNKSRFLQSSLAGLVNETVNPREIFSMRGVVRSFLN